MFYNKTEVNMMGKMLEKNHKVDVICQHNRDGSIIPIKIRVIDEDGEFQTYMIRGYRQLNFREEDVCSVDSIKKHIWRFECKISVFDKEKIITVLYNSYENLWRLVN